MRAIDNTALMDTFARMKIASRFPPYLKRFFPRDLFGRTLLIVILPLVLLQLVIAFLFIHRHINGVSRQMATALVHELQSFIAISESSHSAIRDARLDMLSQHIGYEVTFVRDEARAQEGRAIYTKAPPPRQYHIAQHAVYKTIQTHLSHPFTIGFTQEGKRIWISIALSDGVLSAAIPKSRLFARNPHLLFVWMLVAAIILCVIAILFLRNQIRPLRALVTAVDAYGRGQAKVPFIARGAYEVRQAAIAFSKMRLRIDRHIEQRTLMLSSVSHDLRTPLTRMRLELEMLEPSAEHQALCEDITLMQQLIDEYLAFVRDDTLEELQTADIRVLVRSVVTAFQRGLAASKNEASHIHDSRTERIVLSIPDTPVFMDLREGALKRCIQNLLDNACRYAQRVCITLSRHSGWIELAIDDDGPGIPENAYGEALKAFSRLDPSRNQDSGGGVGLGLAIAHDTARQHGGDLTLHKSPCGGLRALLRLPLSVL